MIRRNHAQKLGALAVIFMFGTLLWPVQDVRAQDRTAEIKTLLKERIALLDDAVKDLTGHYQNGVVEIGVVIEAAREALKAKLELAESPQERVAVVRQLLENANNIVSVAENRMKAGLGQRYTVSQAKAYVLEIRIELLRQEQQAKTDAKKGRN
jgi:outer membrane protein TolC